MANKRNVPKCVSEINLISAPGQGDVVEIGMALVKFGKTMLTLKSEVRNMMTRETILMVDKSIMVNLDENGKPTPHGKTQVEFAKDRLT